MRIELTNKTHWRSDHIRAFLKRSIAEERPAWAETLPLEREAKVSKVIPIDRKLTHAETMLRTAQTREKRAATIRKKWQRRVVYYSKKVAASPGRTA